MGLRIDINGASDRARHPGCPEYPVEDLGARAARGDAAAWQGLVRRYTPLLTRVAMGCGLSISDSGDVVQTAWLRLVQRIGGLRDTEAIGAWLVTTVRREAQACAKRARRENLLPDPTEHVDPAAGPYETAARADVSSRLADALGRLPARDRALLVLLTAGPRPAYQQVARALKMPVGSIGATRARALERLRQELGASGLDNLVLAG